MATGFCVVGVDGLPLASRYWWSLQPKNHPPLSRILVFIFDVLIQASLERPPKMKTGHLRDRFFVCGGWRVRTADPLLVRQMLWTSWANPPKSECKYRLHFPFCKKNPLIFICFMSDHSFWYAKSIYYKDYGRFKNCCISLQPYAIVISLVNMLIISENWDVNPR